MVGLFWLSDAQGALMEPFMPRNQPGARRVDDRRTISGIVHVMGSGCRWQDCPRDYGPPTTVYNRFNRWSRRGFWRGMLSALAEAGWVAESASLDSTYIKAHRSAHGGNVWPAPSASGSFPSAEQSAKTYPAFPPRRLAKMEIRAFWSS